MGEDDTILKAYRSTAIQAEYGTVVDDAWLSLARRPVEMRGGVKLGPLPPRLWERLRLQLQDEYRRATGEPQATLTVALSEHSDA